MVKSKGRRVSKPRCLQDLAAGTRRSVLALGEASQPWGWSLDCFSPGRPAVDFGVKVSDLGQPRLQLAFH